MLNMKEKNHEKSNNSRQCDFCYVQKTFTYSVYKVILRTNKAIYEIGMKNITEQVSDWAMKKGLHLSGSQIVLLRPDLLLQFFKDTKPLETIRGWMFKEYVICDACYPQYIEQVPAR